MKTLVLPFTIFIILALCSCNLNSDKKVNTQQGGKLSNSPLLNQDQNDQHEDILSGAWLFTEYFDADTNEFIEYDQDLDLKHITFNNHNYWTDLYSETELSGTYAFISPYEIACVDKNDMNKTNFFIKIVDEIDQENFEIELIKDSIKERYKIALEVR
jgi:hypothetical protein